jgi:hypothetical protein
MCAFCVPASLSASEFQGAGRLEAKVFTIMCSTQEKEKFLAFLFVKWRLGYHP